MNKIYCHIYQNYLGRNTCHYRDKIGSKMTVHQSKNNHFKIRIELFGIYLDSESQKFRQPVYVYAVTYTSFFIDLEFGSQKWIKNVNCIGK